MKSVFKIYDSVHDFCAADIQNKDRWFTIGGNWAGDRNFAQAKDYFMAGASEREIQPARELIDKIDVAVHGVQGDVWKPQVYGAYPVVADYLAGDPMCMRNRELDESDVSPIRIVLNITVAASLEQYTIARRAAAIVAFAMKLSERRPVELWISAGNHNRMFNVDCGFRVKLDMPVNLSQVVAAFNPSVCRVMAVTHYEHYCNPSYDGNPDSYPFILNGASTYKDRNKFMTEFRKYQNLSEDDIVLDAGILTDCGMIDRNPVEWVKEMLSKYGMPSDD